MHRGVRGGRGHHLGGEGRGARGGRLDLAPLDRATVAREARGRDGGYRGDGDGEAEAIESIATSRSSRRKRSAAVGGGASSSIPLRLELHERIGDEKSATDCVRLGKQTGGDVVHAEIVLSEYIRPICLQDEARGPSSYGKIQVIRWSEQRNLTFAPFKLRHSYLTVVKRDACRVRFAKEQQDFAEDEFCVRGKETVHRKIGQSGCGEKS